MMEKVLDRPVPKTMAKRTRTKFFDQRTLQLMWDSAAAEARYLNQHCRSLQRYGRCGRPGAATREQELLMYDLLLRMADYEPQARITLREALKHGYFDKLARASEGVDAEEDGSTAAHILRLQV